MGGGERKMMMEGEGKEERPKNGGKERIETNVCLCLFMQAVSQTKSSNMPI